MILAALLLPLATSAAVSGISAFGRDVVVSRPVTGRVVALFAQVRIDARVSGDVVVWGGDVSFGPAGAVEGNVSVFGGRIAAPAGRPVPVAGTISTPGTLLRLYLDEMHRAPWEEKSPAPILFGLRLLGLCGWLLTSVALLFVFDSPFARAAVRAEEAWPRPLLAGALGVLTLLLAAAAALALLPSALSVPVAIFVAALAVGAKVFGMGALFLLVGQKLTRSVAPARRPAALAAGFALVAGVSLVPMLGAFAWSAASVVAVGIALTSRFGAPRYRVALV